MARNVQEFEIPLASSMGKDRNGQDITILQVPYCEVSVEDADKLAEMLQSTFDLTESDIEEVFEHIQSKSVARFVLNSMRPHVRPSKRATSNHDESRELDEY